jgi:hypothetical protein
MMRSLDEIRAEIEELTERRSDLLHSLNEGHDSALVADHKAVEEQLEKLWAEQREARARLRFGERDRIIRRARAEERLERAA